MGPKKKYKSTSSSYTFDKGLSIYLIIVESPSKCSKIESYLGQNYKCIASKGHIRELTGLKNIDINSINMLATKIHSLMTTNNIYFCGVGKSENISIHCCNLLKSIGINFSNAFACIGICTFDFSCRCI